MKESRFLGVFIGLLVAGCAAPATPLRAVTPGEVPEIVVYEDAMNHTVIGRLEEYRIDGNHCTVGYGAFVPIRKFTSEYQNICDAALNWLHKRTLLTYENETTMVKLALLTEDS